MPPQGRTPHTDGPAGPAAAPNGRGPLVSLPGAATAGGGEPLGAVSWAMAACDARTPIKPTATVNVRMKRLPSLSVLGEQTKRGARRQANSATCVTVEPTGYAAVRSGSGGTAPIISRAV